MSTTTDSARDIHPIEEVHPRSLKYLAGYLQLLVRGKLWLQVMIGMVLIVCISVGASIGAPATPGIGIVILSMVLGSVGIPAAGIALIMGMDRILDMSRTAINVSGDLVAAKLMDRWVGARASLKDELIEQAVFEDIREKTGEDVLTPEQLN